MAYQPFVDPLQGLRMRGLFDISNRNELPPASPTNPNPGVIDDTAMEHLITPEKFQMEKFDPMEMYNRLYQPETDASRRYEAALGEMPIRNKPGWLRQIGAGISALSGDPNKVEYALYSPYMRQMQDWKQKVDPLAQSANIERQNNMNMRMVAGNILSNMMADRRLENTIRHQQVTEGQGNRRLDQGEQRVDLSRQRVDIARQGLDLKKKLAEGGTVKVNETNGKAFLITRTGEPVELPDLNEMSYGDKLALQAHYQKQVAEFKEMMPGNPDDDDGVFKSVYNPDTQRVEHFYLKKGKGKAPTGEPVTLPGGGTAQVPRSEVDMMKELNRKAKAFRDANPGLGRYITMDRQGNFTIKPPGFFGPSEEEHKQIVEGIHGKGAQGTAPQNAPQNTAPTGGGVRIRDKKTGRTGTIRDPNHPKIKSGEWEVIK